MTWPDEETRAKLMELNAKPWRGECPACQWTLWCADTEDEARNNVAAHIAEKHPPFLPRTWQIQQCLACDAANGVRECAACSAPLCDDCAVMRDFDRYCPGGKCLL